MSLTDVELMLRFQEGKASAFTMLVKRHQTAILNYLYRLTWSRELAEDLTQEVFIKVYQSAGAYAPTAKFTTYLYRIARNHWIDWCRTKGARPRPTTLEAATDGGGALKDALPGREENPVDALERRELRARLMQAIDELPEEQRQVFIMSESQGLKYADIATVLDIPVGTVKSRMHTAVRRLRASLGPWLERAAE